MAEAKQNFVDYAERMHKIGKIQQAFAALKELADISPEGAHLRETLEEHLGCMVIRSGVRPGRRRRRRRRLRPQRTLEVG